VSKLELSNTHYDVYDRESDYWRDMEDALPNKKDPSKAATDEGQDNNKPTHSISQDSKNIPMGDK